MIEADARLRKARANKEARLNFVHITKVKRFANRGTTTSVRKGSVNVVAFMLVT